MNETFATLAFAAVIAVGAAAFTRRMGWGMAIPLLILGIFIGIIPWGPDAIPEPEVILIFILAPLVFGESLSSSFLDLRRVSKAVIMLAVVLVIVATFTVGFAASAAVALPLGMAVALGAILAPTDAVAVGAVAKSAKMPRKLVSILEGESLVNDGTGLTMLSVAIAAVSAGAITLAEVTSVFVVSVAGGLIIGLVAGYLLSLALKHGKDMVAVNALILVAPFALYVLGEEIEASGILAVVVAGLMIAHTLNSQADHGGRLQSVIVWKHITFALQAMAFFLIGLEFPEVIRRLEPDHLRMVLILVPVVLVVMILTRMVFVYLMVWAGGKRNREAKGTMVLKRTFILGWAGARGPVSGLAAFSIPLVLASGAETPYRDVVIAVTFSIVFITLLLSLTLAPLVRALKIEPDDDTELMKHVNSQLVLAAMVRLDELIAQAEESGKPYTESAKNQLRAEIAHRAHRHGVDSEATKAITADESSRMLQAMEQMITAQQDELLRLRADEELPESIIRPMLRTLDARQEAIRSLE